VSWPSAKQSDKREESKAVRREEEDESQIDWLSIDPVGGSKKNLEKNLGSI